MFLKREGEFRNSITFYLSIQTISPEAMHVEEIKNKIQKKRYTTYINFEQKKNIR